MVDLFEEPAGRRDTKPRIVARETAGSDSGLRPEPSSDSKTATGLVTRSEALLSLVGLPAGTPVASAETRRGFPLRVPAEFTAGMEVGNPKDPLLAQVLPAPAEDVSVDGYVTDPLEEVSAQPAPGLLQKYRGRALLVVTGACPIHCRYCFRRHFPYQQARGSGKRLSAAMDAIREDSSIHEVILSGGDPLSLSSSRLAELTDELAKISHVRRLRLHTRFPVAAPSRIDRGLTRWMENLSVPLVTVLHSNHPAELSDSVKFACERLGDAGTTLLNQSVLLRGVNDSADVLVALSERLFSVGVLPYYLHQLDPVAGAAHFAVSDLRAKEVVAAAAARLPGYLVPRLVRERPGRSSKTPLFYRPQPAE